MAALLFASAMLLACGVAAVRNCHPRCRCEVETFGLFDSFSLTKVDCSGAGPDAAPVPIPLDTSFLDLSSNSIRSINDAMLTGPGYTTLVSLDLSNNDISQVGANAFSKLRYLETLDLSANELESLSETSFVGLPLVEVDLSHNRFQQFSLDLFTTKGQEKPLTVDLSSNLLTAVTRNPQGPPLSIKSLLLADNRLRTVPKLSGLPLRFLSLDGNQISTIKAGDFQELRDLSYLSLSGLGPLSHIQPGSFRGLENLQVLDLSNNGELKALSPEVFGGLASLQELNLSHSGLARLPGDVLKHLPSIRSIALGPKMRCWRTRRQGQFHRQMGQAKSDDVITCDGPGIVSHQPAA
ncbi:tsukushi isoform X2 [Denticeps clupeoides]|uniref:Tsukushi n=2 Tax=Denticeps clupeoides TaxID=299321 RepID=A0AAY4D8B6_9TELE|nr:tsukushin isoform X2 [Denticeps clupeoides]XP_028856033.1 tsukushin isoform X2 [Denticeps clupeoides]